MNGPVANPRCPTTILSPNFKSDNLKTLNSERDQRSESLIHGPCVDSALSTRCFETWSLRCKDFGNEVERLLSTKKRTGENQVSGRLLSSIKSVRSAALPCRRK